MSWFKNLFGFESQLEDAPWPQPLEESDEQEEYDVEYHVMVEYNPNRSEDFYFRAKYYYFDDGFVHFVDCNRETVGSVLAQRVIVIEQLEEHEVADPEDVINTLSKSDTFEVTK